MNSKHAQKVRHLFRQAGQGMTEYIIIVALIAIGSIGIYSVFGNTLRGQMAVATHALAGSTSAADTARSTVGTTAAKADSNVTKRGLGDFQEKAE